jgi:hypothetical protein
MYMYNELLCLCTVKSNGGPSLTTSNSKLVMCVMFAFACLVRVVVCAVGCSCSKCVFSCRCEGGGSE